MTNASYVQVDINAPRDLGHDIYKKELTVSIHLNFQDQYHIMYLKMWDLLFYPPTKCNLQLLVPI